MPELDALVGIDTTLVRGVATEDGHGVEDGGYNEGDPIRVMGETDQPRVQR